MNKWKIEEAYPINKKITVEKLIDEKHKEYNTFKIVTLSGRPLTNKFHYEDLNIYADYRKYKVLYIDESLEGTYLIFIDY